MSEPDATPSAIWVISDVALDGTYITTVHADVAARDACARFFVGDLAPSPSPLAWDQPGRDVAADMRRHMALLAALPPPRPNVLKVDIVAAEWLREMLDTVPAPTSPHDPVNALLSLPIVVDDSLPEGTWRLVGPDGTILHEGTVTP